MLLPPVSNGSSDTEFLSRLGYFHTIPAVFLKSFWRRTVVYSLLLLYILFIRTARTVFVFVDGYFGFIAAFTCLLFQENRLQFLPGIAGIGICPFIITYVLPFTDILFKIPLFPFLIRLWFDIGLLFLLPQITVTFFAFVSGICRYTGITEFKFFFLFKKGTRVQTSLRSWKISVATMDSLSTAICTLYPSFNWALRIWSSFMCMNVASGSVLQ